MGAFTRFFDTTGRKYAESPYPAWVTAATFLSLYPTTRTSTIPATTASTPTYTPTPKLKIQRGPPTPLSIALFSSAFLIGGFISYDGATTDGAGVTAAWSILYLLSKDTRRSLAPSRVFGNGGTSLWGRVGPLGLVGLVGLNAATHGWVWLKGGKRETDYKGGRGWVGDI
ncbi:hypothetical protein EV426DRAFT_186262 [Tirmania nivea]|nr:hypothetical protein EV426DRAFT_186262 [Tirmania nivea]